MNVVEKIKSGWAAWLFQGIPAAAVVLGAVLTLGKTLGDYDRRVRTLEDDRVSTAQQMQTLTREVTDMRLQIQELSDDLRIKGDINYQQHPRKRINYRQDQISDGR